MSSSPTPTPSTQIAQKGRRKQQIKFNTDEDVALCEAHIAITGDGSVGVGQGKTKYWERIIPLFIEKTKGNPNVRDKTSLENRIYQIKKEIKLFVAVLGKLYRGGRVSGYGQEHTLIRGRCEFHKIHGRPFILDECYEVYKSEPGYDYTKYVDIPPLPPPPVVQVVDDLGVDGVHGADDVEEEEIGVDVNTGDTQEKNKRGPGKKALQALKQAKYPCGTSSGSIESNFSETNERMLSYLKEQEEQLKEENMSRIKEKKKARVERIMMADISKLSSAGQAWVERKQNKILEKRNLMEQDSSNDE